MLSGGMAIMIKAFKSRQQMLAKLQFLLGYNNRMSQRLVRAIRLIVAQDNTSYKANVRDTPEKY
jgi:hypothetical protein